MRLGEGGYMFSTMGGLEISHDGSAWQVNNGSLHQVGIVTRHGHLKFSKSVSSRRDAMKSISGKGPSKFTAWASVFRCGLSLLGLLLAGCFDLDPKPVPVAY